MKRSTTNDPETHSADIVAENVERLKALFPEAFTEGKVGFEVLKQLLGGAVDKREEKYCLNWHGKRQARQLALTPSTGTLRPFPELSVDWDTMQNPMIKGPTRKCSSIPCRFTFNKTEKRYRFYGTDNTQELPLLP